MKVVICGGGIMGVSVAYSLAKRGIKSTIVERLEVACAASGKAGGFLARDWCDSYELGPLANLSYDMHMSYAKDDRFKECDYRNLTTFSVTVREAGQKLPLKIDLPNWLDGVVTKASLIGNKSNTAQVHPKKLTETLLRLAVDMVETEVRTGVVSGMVLADDRTIQGVRIGDEVLPADVVVVCLGPWSGQAMDWLDLPQVKGQRGHSIIVEPASPVTAEALFIEYVAKADSSRSPEVYPRPDGTVYVCGMGDMEPIPEDPSQIQYDSTSCQTIHEMLQQLSSAFNGCMTLTEQACYLPISQDGLPLIGPVPNTKGAYIATGHSCWGILNAPATGETISQLIVDGSCSLLDLSPFDPARFK